MGSYFLNIKTNKVHYISEERTSCRTRMFNNPDNYKEYSSLEEIKQTGKKISICDICMYGEARKEYIETFGDNDEDNKIIYDKRSQKGLDEGSIYVVLSFAFIIICIVAIFFMFQSGGDSSYEYTCDFPGCNDHAEYSTGGHKYCPKHYRIVH